eukprot:681143_1
MQTRRYNRDGIGSKQLQLRYIVNGKDYGIAFRVEKTEYRAAISLRTEGIVELLSYKQGDDDVKCNQCDEFEKQITKLKKTHLLAMSDNESVVKAMQQRIMSLEGIEAKHKAAMETIQELKTSLDSVNEQERTNSKNKQDEIERLKLGNTNLHKRKREALEHVARLETENKSLQKHYDDSTAECKELQMELKTVTAKYDALCRKANIDVKKHMHWDCDTIVDWIVSLNGEYEAYEETLRMKMKEEGMDGSLLSELDRNDLHRFGIVSLKHKVQILKHIKALRRHQTKPQNEVIAAADNEGDYVTPYI